MRTNSNSLKARHGQQAGASAVIVVNNESHILFVGAGSEDEYYAITIPVVGMALGNYQKMTKYASLLVYS